MKICFVIENYIPHVGGVEIVFKNLAERLSKKHEVHLITHRLKGTKKNETINGVKVHRVSVPKWGARYWFSLLSIPLVWKYAKSADIVHTTTYNGAPPARFVALLQRKPSVITIHEVLGREWKKLGTMSYPIAILHQALEWCIVHFNFTRFICVSNSSKNTLLAVRNISAKVIHNGLDYDFWNPKKYDGTPIRKKLGVEKNFVYLFFGRPGVTKGVEYLVEAIPKIQKEIPNAKCVLILSKDPQYTVRYNTIIERIKELKCSESTLILDPVKRENLPNYLMAADCIVIPSLTEGFGYTTAESCALGRPVVASDTTSIPEVISGKHVLVKPKDPKSIAKGIIQVAKKKYDESPPKKFTWERMAKEYEKVYKQLLKK